MLLNIIPLFLKGLFSEKLFFSEIKPMGAQYFDNRAPIALRGPKCSVSDPDPDPDPDQETLIWIRVPKKNCDKLAYKSTKIIKI